MLANTDVTFNKANALDATQIKSFNDTVLWASFKKGNDLAFSMLYKRHVQRLYNYGMHTCKDHDLVMDCLQELFSRLWSKRETIAEVNAVKLYLFKSFRRLLIHQLVARRRFSLPLSGQPDSVFEFIPSFEESLIEDEQKARLYAQLKASIESLTKRQREVIFLKFFNDLTYAEVSVIMDLQVDSVYNLVSKVIEILRKKMGVSAIMVTSLLLAASCEPA
jgi:RNA polymerase sigma factor (sigma-70 family)